MTLMPNMPPPNPPTSDAIQLAARIGHPQGHSTLLSSHKHDGSTEERIYLDAVNRNGIVAKTYPDFTRYRNPDDEILNRKVSNNKLEKGDKNR